MKSKILLLAVSVALLTSCTTSYKTGQTPDDVYYSPVRPHDEFVKTEKKEKKEKYDETSYRNNDDEYYGDRYLRMKVRDRYRWSQLDDPYYYNRQFTYSSYNCFCYANPWTPSSYWNNYYNPYYQSNVILNPKTSTVYTGPRTFNLNTYNNNALTNSNYTNPKYTSPRNNGSTNNNNYNSNNTNTYKAPRNSNTRSDENSGNTLRDIFKGSTNSSGNSGNSTSPSNNSSNNSGSTPSSGSSTPAPVRKF